MIAKLNLTRPILVFPGAWNPAIFSPPWVAQYLHEYPEGDEVEATLIQEAGSTNAPIVFIREIGISAANNRIQFFVNNFEQFEALDKPVIRMLKSLPHTPMKAFGVNFFYSLEDVSPEFLEELKTRETFEDSYEISSFVYKNTLIRESRGVINLTRKWQDDHHEIDFNFHFGVDSKNEIIESFENDIVNEAFEESKKILCEHYNCALKGQTAFSSKSDG